MLVSDERSIGIEYRLIRIDADRLVEIVLRLAVLVPAVRDIRHREVGIGQRGREGERFLKEPLSRYGVTLLQSETAIDQIAIRIVGMVSVEVIQKATG